jgi:hypothetical protein
MGKFLVKMPTRALSDGETIYYMMTYIKNTLQLMSSVGNPAYYGLTIGMTPSEKMISHTYTPSPRIKISQ